MIPLETFTQRGAALTSVLCVHKKQKQGSKAAGPGGGGKRNGPWARWAVGQGWGFRGAVLAGV